MLNLHSKIEEIASTLHNVTLETDQVMAIVDLVFADGGDNLHFHVDYYIEMNNLG